MLNIREMTDQERVLEAVLLFFQPGPWTQAQHQDWYLLTGQIQCTTKVLCDLARKVLHKSEPTPGREGERDD